MACTEAVLEQLTTLLGEDAALTICAEDGAGCTGDATACAISYLSGKIGEAQTPGDDAYLGLNVSFLLNSGYMVFLMQLGFAMLCAGLIRSKSQHNILLKNVLDACIGGIAWYLVGFGFAFGHKDPEKEPNPFIGTWNFAIKQTVDVSYNDSAAFATNGYQSFFFQWAFAAATATITSGAVAERCTFLAYICYSFFMTAFVYPVVVHSVWSAGGWLSPWSTNFGPDNDRALIMKAGAVDFAGSGVVHMSGGIAALVGAWIIGPRLGRFANGKIADPMPGHSAHLVVLGTFLLWFGWYGFNPGSNLVIAGFASSSIVSRVAVTTTLAGCAGGVVMLALRYVFTRTFDLVYTCNGILAGLVGITAGCSVVEPWAAVVIGGLAPLIFYASEVWTHRMHIDDAVSAFPLHGACGAWGVLMVGFFAKPNYTEQVYGASGMAPGGGRYGVFYGGKGQILLCQFIEVVFITLWVGLCLGALFGVLKLVGKLRVSEEEESKGLDVSMHGGRTSADMIVNTVRKHSGAVGDAEFSK